MKEPKKYLQYTIRYTVDAEDLNAIADLLNTVDMEMEVVDVVVITRPDKE